MRLVRTDIIPSPDDPTQVRFVGVVQSDSAPAAPVELYVDVPEALAPALSTSGNPWLVCLLIVAAHWREPLRIDLPVDRRLYEGAHDLVRLWHHWGWVPEPYVPIHAEREDLPPGAPRPERTMLFHSGGVDSMFSLAADTPDLHPERAWQIDDLVLVWGLDIALENTTKFYEIIRRQQRVADAVGKPLLAIRSNVATLLRRVPWLQSHGAAMAFLALALENRWRRVLLAADAHYEQPVPWGIHPLIAPHWTTARQSIHIDGSAWSRVEKVAHLADFSPAYDTLRVCTVPGQIDNCSVCGKCIRTMLALDIVGALDRFTAFDSARYEEGLRTCTPGRFSPYYLTELREAAIQRGRPDALARVDALDRRWHGPHRRQRLERLLSEWVMPGWLAARVGDAVDWGYVNLVRRRRTSATS